jgi:Zn-finger nucleic acid-binding protein
MQSKELSKMPDVFLEVEALPEQEDKNDKHTGLCPDGHGIMLRAKVDIDEPFYLERCTHCGGVWFDNGEWKRVIDNHLLTSLSDLWSTSWQRKRREEEGRERFMQMNREHLGDHIYDSVVALAQMLKEHPQQKRAISLLQAELDE